MQEKKVNNFSHKPVFLNEVIENFNLKEDGIYVDCTIGLAGHSLKIANNIKTGKLIGFDKDQEALNISKAKLKNKKNIITLIKSDYFHIKKELHNIGITHVDGILFDLGVSSMQIDNETRGFSYHTDGPLDMRMDQDQDITAGKIINNASLDELTRIIRVNSESRYARLVAKKIVELRPINSTIEFVEVLRKALPAFVLRKKHPGKTFFQAFRIEVNNELINLKQSLLDAISLLKPQGILQVITFHSIEDRIVKKLFYDLTIDKTKDLPLKDYKLFTKKQIKLSKNELLNNSRSHSAKLRILRKLR